MRATSQLGFAAAGPAGQDTFGKLLTPVRVSSAGEHVADRLVTAIALGEFVPGQRLPPERELAALLEVSRSTIREALQRLQAAGYVITRRGRGGGTFVRTSQGPEADEMIRRTLLPAWDDLTELLDFRLLIEQAVARAAADRRDDEDIAGIREAAAAYERASDREASQLADHALHMAIARATHNARLADLSARIRRAVSLGFNALPYSATARRRALRQHPELVAAITAGNAQAAATLAARHFSMTEDLLRGLHARIRLRSGEDSAARGQANDIGQHQTSG